MKTEITEAATTWFDTLGNNTQLQLVMNNKGVINSIEQIVSIWVQEVVKPYWDSKSDIKKANLSLKNLEKQK